MSAELKSNVCSVKPIAKNGGKTANSGLVAHNKTFDAGPWVLVDVTTYNYFIASSTEAQVS